MNRAIVMAISALVLWGCDTSKAEIPECQNIFDPSIGKFKHPVLPCIANGGFRNGLGSASGFRLYETAEERDAQLSDGFAKIGKKYGHWIYKDKDGNIINTEAYDRNGELISQ